jgi:hypothetical protein
LKVAKHGKGEYVYLVRFHYLPPGGGRRARQRSVQRQRVKHEATKPPR